MQQRAPYPHELIELVEGFKFFPGWTFQIDEGQVYDGVAGLLLMIYVNAPDSHKDNGETSIIAYPHMVPAEVHTRDGWRLWLWQRIMKVLRHEAGEFFCDKGEYPFMPQHWPVADGYNQGLDESEL